MNERGDTSAPPRATPTRQVSCSVCGEVGHNKGTCKQKPADQEDEKRSLTCAICHQTGHNKRTCDRRHSTGTDVPKKIPTCLACNGEGRIFKGGKMTKCACKAGQKLLVGPPGVLALPVPGPQHLYGECQRQIPYPNGALSVDGCQLFEAEADEGPGERKCAACGCHRNFHRVIVPQPLSSTAPSPGKKLKTSGGPTSSGLGPMTAPSLAVMSTPLQMQAQQPPHIMMLPSTMPGMGGGDDQAPQLPPPQSVSDSTAMMSLAGMAASSGGPPGSMGDGHGSASGFVGIMDRGQLHPGGMMGGMHPMHAHPHPSGMGPPGPMMGHATYMGPSGHVVMVSPMSHVGGPPGGMVGHMQPRQMPPGAHAVGPVGAAPAQPHTAAAPPMGAPAPSSAGAPVSAGPAPSAGSSAAPFPSGVASAGAGVDIATAGSIPAATVGAAIAGAEENGPPPRVDAPPSDAAPVAAHKAQAAESPAPSSSSPTPARSSPVGATPVGATPASVGLAPATVPAMAGPGVPVPLPGGAPVGAPMSSGAVGAGKVAGSTGPATSGMQRR